MSKHRTDVRVVESFDPERYEQLVRDNLQTQGIFVPVKELEGRGDARAGLPEPHKVRIGAFHDDRLVGLSYGASVNARQFVMHISLVEPAFRRQGVYSRMLERMLQETREYDEIDSQHHLFNNPIIIPKLRCGFVIVGIDHSVAVGPRVLLRYFHNQRLFEAMRFRVGLRANPQSDPGGRIAPTKE